MDNTRPAEPTLRPRGRIEAIDLARGIALIAMAIYHFTWDLELFRYVEPGLTAVGGWKMFARCIASSFLFLAGVSLYLAHGNGIRWNGFWQRLAMVGGAALVISIATYLTMPDTFIFFGILHEIAVASVLGLLFLRLPSLVLLVLAAAVIATPFYFRADIFNHPLLWWVGLSTQPLRSNDYVPVFPWFGAVLIGIAAARIASAVGLFERFRAVSFGRWSRPLQFAGRHSLAFYLIHQPVLISLVWLASQVTPPNLQERFVNDCRRQCEEAREETFCEPYCDCVLDGLAKAGVLEDVLALSMSTAVNDTVLDTAMMCTNETENLMPEGGSE